MKKIIKFRGQGKTADLIKMSAETGYRIIALSDTRYIVDMSKQMGVEIPQPITRKECNLAQYRNDEKPFLIDELEQFVINSIGHEIYAATLNAEDIIQDFENDLNLMKSTLHKLLIKYITLVEKNEFNVSYQVLKNIDLLKQQITDKSKISVGRF